MSASSVTAERLRKLTEDIIKTITSDEFMSRMEAMRTAPPAERVQKAQEMLSIEGLRKAGLDLPKGMRVSSRYFEQGVGMFEFGNANISQKIGAIDPAFLSKLKSDKPEVYKKLSQSKDISEALCVTSGAVVMGACGGAGAGTVCACGGSC